MQPTLGLGAVRPRAASPSLAASIIQSASFNAELLLELLEFALAGLFLPVPFIGSFLLIGLDVGVGPFGSIILDIDDLLRGSCVDLRIDQENDQDDDRYEQRQAGPDHLLAASLAKKCL